MSTLLAGVNTFLSKEHTGKIATEIELIRSTEGEKGQQIENVRGRQQSRNELAPKGETSHGHLADADEEAPMVHDGHGQIGRAHVGTPVTNAHLVCRLLLEKKN